MFLKVQLKLKLSLSQKRNIVKSYKVSILCVDWKHHNYVFVVATFSWTSQCVVSNFWRDSQTTDRD